VNTYEDGYERGYLIAQARAESRQELGIPLVATAEWDARLDAMRRTGTTIDKFDADCRYVYPNGFPCYMNPREHVHS
jgi:hypothetical protein